MNRQDVILGCDPEAIWQMDGTGYRGMLPAGIVLNRLKKVGSKLITGDYKGYPCIETDNGLIFADGAGWELNPKPGNVGTLLDNTSGLLKTSLQIEQGLSQIDKSISLKVTPSMHFRLEMLDIWQDEQLAIFGCDPDKSIWPRQVDPSKVDASKHDRRYFGGHIHIGYPLDSPEEFYEDMDNLRRMIVLADGILGMAGVIMDYFTETGGYDRRLVYGQPGVYRPQSHGIEYRTISNSWMVSRTFARHMLTLASFLPMLLDTDMPEYLLEKGKAIRRILIEGYIYKASKFLSPLRSMVDDEDWRSTISWLKSKGRVDYPSRPDWRTGWRMQDDN